MGLLDRILGRNQEKKEAAPSPSEIAAFFNEAAKDEEHFPSTIDPRILHVRSILEH
ncbi:MAG: hypothetical protein JST65_04875, partial [Acidobacteria bacterium]|nr:hypothetical protein [Acidobacteriota bacterium]